MTTLILKRASDSRPSGQWNDDDYDVLADGAVVGRIFDAAASPVGTPWMWTLAFGHHEDRTPTHGYAERREAAMAAFAKSDYASASTFMANSREQGMKEAAKYYEENMKMFGELRLVRAITEEQIEIMRDPKRAPTAKLPRIEDAVKAGGFLCGNADDLIEHFKALEKKYP